MWNLICLLFLEYFIVFVMILLNICVILLGLNFVKIVFFGIFWINVVFFVDILCWLIILLMNMLKLIIFLLIWLDLLFILDNCSKLLISWIICFVFLWVIDKNCGVSFLFFYVFFLSVLM